MSLYVRSYNLSNLHDGEIVVYNGDTAGSYFTKGAVPMEPRNESVSPDIAFAAELFAKLPANSQEALIALIKSLLSEQ